MGARATPPTLAPPGWSPVSGQPAEAEQWHDARLHVGDFTGDLAEARVHVDTLQQGRFVFPARLPSTLPAASWSAVNATGFDRLARDVGAVSIAAVKIRLDRATCTPGDTSILSEMSTGIELRWRLLLFLRRPAGLTFCGLADL